MGSAEAAVERFPVIIEGVDEALSCPADQEILNAMVQLGRRGIPIGCHGGGCGVCKVRILEGGVRTQKMSRDHVSLEEEKAGYVLACKAIPTSPLKLQVVGGMKKGVFGRKIDPLRDAGRRSGSQ